MPAFPYWSKDDFETLTSVTTFSEMVPIALAVLKRMPQPIAQLCGPISTGGKGSIEKNLQEFDKAITILETRGITIFNQMPFEAPMQRIKTSRGKTGHDMSLLEEFYLPLFESRLVSTLYFLPGWKSSIGAQWEYKQAKRFGMTTLELSDTFGSETPI